jgi:hypothetical protein
VYWPFDLGRTTGLTLAVVAVIVVFLASLMGARKKST